MATPNFHKAMSSNYHVIESEDNIDLYDLREQVLECDGFGPSSVHRTRWGDFVLGEKETVARYGKRCTFDLSLTTLVSLNAGHYCGANVDYELHAHVDGGSDFILSTFDTLEDAVDALIEDAFDNADYDMVWYNKGLQKTHEESIRKLYTEAIEKAMEEGEKICESMAETHLRCVGVFSNGEAVYEVAG